MSDGVRERSGRWSVAGVGALTLAGVGFLYTAPLVIAAAAVPAAFAAYDALTTVPSQGRVRVTREFGASAPRPGERVTVTLTVENTGDSAIPDLRVVDGVPDELAVASGAPRVSTALSSGAKAAVEYEVVAKRGSYEFGAPVARARSFSASTAVTVDVAPEGDTELSGQRAVDAPPITDSTTLRAGTQTTDRGGSGLEFYATREYQHGDPVNRLNWRQYAKTGELSTVEFREEHAVRAALVVDARQPTRVVPGPGEPTGTELAGYVGRRLHGALTAASIDTDVTAVGLAADHGAPLGPDGLPWVDAADGRETANLVFSAVEAAADDTPDPDAAWQSTPPNTESWDAATTRWVPELSERLPPRAEVVLVSPLLDNWPVRTASALATRGYGVTVVSPDVVPESSVGGRLARVHRDLRTRTLRERDVHVVDWDLDDPLDTVLDTSLSHLLSQ